MNLVKIIEEQLDVEIDKSSIDYMRLIRHLRFTIERVVARGRSCRTGKNYSIVEKGISDML